MAPTIGESSADAVKAGTDIVEVELVVEHLVLPAHDLAL